MHDLVVKAMLENDRSNLLEGQHYSSWRIRNIVEDKHALQTQQFLRHSDISYDYIERVLDRGLPKRLANEATDGLVGGIALRCELEGIRFSKWS